MPGSGTLAVRSAGAGASGGRRNIAWASRSSSGRRKAPAALPDRAPSTSGQELAATVRQRWPGVPVLLMSGHVGVISHQQATTEGSPIIKKPFTAHRLEAAAREGLAGARQGLAASRHPPEPPGDVMTSPP